MLSMATLTMVFVAIMASPLHAKPPLGYPISETAVIGNDDDIGADDIWDDLLANSRSLLNAFDDNDNEKEARKSNDLVFPQLSREQQAFAVNPGYKAYRGGVDEATLELDDAKSSKHDSSLASRATKKSELDRSRSIDLPLMARFEMDEAELRDLYFTGLVAGCSALAVFVIVSLGFCYHRARRNSKASEDVDYPAYGVTGPGKAKSESASNSKTADRKLAQNAHMYHYQHQKQQMIAFDRASNGQRNGISGTSEDDNDSDDNEEADYTVYECPGLATGGEMEVHNPLFKDDSGSPKK